MLKRGLIRSNNQQIRDISHRFVFLGIQVLLSFPLFIHLLRSAPMHFQNGQQIQNWLEKTPPEYLDTILVLSVMTIILQLIFNLVIVQFIPKFLELKIYSRNWFYSYLGLFILLTPLLVILHLVEFKDIELGVTATQGSTAYGISATNTDNFHITGRIDLFREVVFNSYFLLFNFY